MSEQYWEERYQKGETEWDKGEPSPGLVDFLAARPAPATGTPLTVLVPGCGTGHDVRAWARAGCRATGLDIAPSAVERAQTRNAQEKLPCVFRQGDFLNDSPFELFDFVFEHTLFCAIQPIERDTYVQATSRWLKENGRYVAVFYLIPDKDGPPFGSTREEIHQRFDRAFELEEEWVPRSYPNRTGLEWMTVWRKRQNRLG